MKRFFSVLAALGLALSLTAGQASANIIYDFSGVTFSDGGTLSGSFTTNDAMNALIDYDITTSTNGGFGFHYTPLTTISTSTSLPGILVVETASLSEILQITFTGLTTSGAVITIGQFDSFEQNATQQHRQIVSGEVVAVTPVPEPSPLSLMGIGLLALVAYLAIRRRRR